MSEEQSGSKGKDRYEGLKIASTSCHAFFGAQFDGAGSEVSYVFNTRLPFH